MVVKKLVDYAMELIAVTYIRKMTGLMQRNALRLRVRTDEHLP
jgi:hypothetical protein